MSTAADLPATTGLEPEVTPQAKPGDIDDGQAIYIGSVVHRKVSVKGTGGVFCDCSSYGATGTGVDVDSAAIHLGSDYEAREG